MDSSLLRSMSAHRCTRQFDCRYGAVPAHRTAPGSGGSPSPPEHIRAQGIPGYLNFLFLLFFSSFLYGYTVLPYQYLLPNASSYALRFDILYLLENLVLVLAVSFLIVRARPPWKSFILICWVRPPICSKLYGCQPCHRLGRLPQGEALWSGPDRFGLLVCVDPVALSPANNNGCRRNPIRWRPRLRGVGVGHAQCGADLRSYRVAAVPEE